MKCYNCGCENDAFKRMYFFCNQCYSISPVLIEPGKTYTTTTRHIEEIQMNLGSVVYLKKEVEERFSKSITDAARAIQRINLHVLKKQENKLMYLLRNMKIVLSRVALFSDGEVPFEAICGEVLREATSPAEVASDAYQENFEKFKKTQVKINKKLEMECKKLKKKIKKGEKKMTQDRNDPCNCNDEVEFLKKSLWSIDMENSKEVEEQREVDEESRKFLAMMDENAKDFTVIVEKDLKKVVKEVNVEKQEEVRTYMDLEVKLENANYLLKKKNDEIEKLNTELNKLRIFELEKKSMDDYIEQLTDHVGRLTKDLREKEVECSNCKVLTEMLEQEKKKREIQLKEFETRLKAVGKILMSKNDELDQLKNKIEKFSAEQNHENSMKEAVEELITTVYQLKGELKDEQKKCDYLQETNTTLEKELFDEIRKRKDIEIELEGANRSLEEMNCEMTGRKIKLKELQIVQSQRETMETVMKKQYLEITKLKKQLSTEQKKYTCLEEDNLELTKSLEKTMKELREEALMSRDYRDQARDYANELSLVSQNLEWAQKQLQEERTKKEEIDFEDLVDAMTRYEEGDDGLEWTNDSYESFESVTNEFSQSIEAEEIFEDAWKSSNNEEF